ncbi:antitoxin MazE family protein [Saccharomonospora sp. NPDC046836]|uniref:antitoxin MazE family protein n=1 Tax=Saccharomonospora sp. NPDC046836 TaxID=3156921 RepID=UPI0033CD2FDD
MGSRSDAAARVRAHRARLRRQGLRPIQIWVPDTSSPEFAEAARAQSEAVARSGGEADDMAWVEAAAYSLGDDE